jgi:hypothetical protein
MACKDGIATDHDGNADRLGRRLCTGARGGRSDAVPLTEEAKAANKAIWELVEPFDGFERWLECSRRAVRFPSEGRCLLVDYKDSTGSTNPRDHYYGHAAYTRRNAMLFNTTQIVGTFYSS